MRLPWLRRPRVSLILSLILASLLVLAVTVFWFAESRPNPVPTAQAFYSALWKAHFAEAERLVTAQGKAELQKREGILLTLKPMLSDHTGGTHPVPQMTAAVHRKGNTATVVLSSPPSGPQRHFVAVLVWSHGRWLVDRFS